MITVIDTGCTGYSTQGYLLIHKSMTQIGQLQITLMNAAYITLAVIYLLSFSILLGIQFIVYRPLCKITEAAKQYASGNLDYEIPVNTEDEIGYLSASLNFMSSQLRDMEEKGLVNRQVYAEVPPRVEYSLTDLGKSLKPILDAMWIWGGGL